MTQRLGNRRTDNESMAEIGARTGHTEFCIWYAHETLLCAGFPDFDDAKAAIEDALDQGDVTCKCGE